METCPCNSGNTYSECCGLYHKGKAPESALALMRSRYTAYVLKNIEYLISTTHPENPERELGENSWKRKIAEFSDKTEFQKLEILGFRDGKSEAVVVFTAHMLQNGLDVTFTEKSEFIKTEGKWLYLIGEIKWGRASLEDFSLKKDAES